jgi:uncharacterized protein YjbI with pentapeptide repeats
MVLSGTDFRAAVLGDDDFGVSTVVDADFLAVDLIGADFRTVVLSDEGLGVTAFVGAALRDADLAGARLVDGDDPLARFPPRFAAADRGLLRLVAMLAPRY